MIYYLLLKLQNTVTFFPYSIRNYNPMTQKFEQKMWQEILAEILEEFLVTVEI